MFVVSSFWVLFLFEGLSEQGWLSINVVKEFTQLQRQYIMDGSYT